MILPYETLESRWAWLAANLAVWLVLVGLFTQGIEVWRLITARFGTGQVAVAPFIVSAVLLAGAGVFAWTRREALAWPWVALALAVFVAGLLSADPDFPAKRVHVAQYFFLAIVVYRSLRAFMHEGRAIWSCVVLAAMLGGIDEIVQGALPTRTFGLRDLVTNGAGAVAAGLFLQALSARGRTFGQAGALLPGAGLLVGLALLLVAANAYKGTGFPLWIYLPAVASLALPAAFGLPEDSRLLSAMTAVSMIAIVSLFAIDALALDFR